MGTLLATLSRRIFILDHAFQELTAHYYEYDLTVAKYLSGKGFEVNLYSNVDASSVEGFVPHFHVGFGGRSRGCSRKWMYAQFAKMALNGLFRACKQTVQCLDIADQEWAMVYTADILSLLAKMAFTNEDVWFLPNATYRELPVLRVILGALPAGKRPKLALLLRRNIEGPGVLREELEKGEYSARQSGEQVRLLAEALGDGLRLFTDTVPLAQELQKASGHKFAVLPVPFRIDKLHPVTPRSGTRKRLLYIGGAREEKGFCQLPELFASLRAGFADGSLEAVVHAFPLDTEPLQRTAALLSETPSVRLIEGSLTTDEYYDEMMAADAVCVLYDPARYRSRSSCILVEALTAGKVALVSKGSWMEGFAGGHPRKITLDFGKPRLELVNFMAALDKKPESADFEANYEYIYPDGLAPFLNIAK